jgi:hydrogenase large subunit
VDALHPSDGITVPKYTGPQPPYKELDENKTYSWVKAPRWNGNAMEVGPLARVLVGYASGRPEFKEVVTMALTKLNLPAEALFSTLGRIAARGLECHLAAHWLMDEFNNLMANLKAGDWVTANTQNWEPSTWPIDCHGVGFTEAPRGALAHWIHIKDQKIENYQCVVPTTWNASPRDDKGQIGAYESALLGTPVHDPKQPLEILRTIHSFDPCLACATHLFGPNGESLAEVKVL